MLNSCIFVADCPSCGAVGAHMYLCGKDVWCSRCHTEVGEERRKYELDLGTCAEDTDS